MNYVQTKLIFDDLINKGIIQEQDKFEKARALGVTAFPASENKKKHALHLFRKVETVHR